MRLIQVVAKINTVSNMRLKFDSILAISPPPHIKNITALKITRVMPLYLLDAMWTLTVCIF